MLADNQSLLVCTYLVHPASLRGRTHEHATDGRKVCSDVSFKLSKHQHQPQSKTETAISSLHLPCANQAEYAQDTQQHWVQDPVSSKPAVLIKKYNISQQKELELQLASQQVALQRFVLYPSSAVSVKHHPSAL